MQAKWPAMIQDETNMQNENAENSHEDKQSKYYLSMLSETSELTFPALVRSI